MNASRRRAPDARPPPMVPSRALWAANAVRLAWKAIDDNRAIISQSCSKPNDEIADLIESGSGKRFSRHVVSRHRPVLGLHDGGPRRNDRTSALRRRKPWPGQLARKPWALRSVSCDVLIEVGAVRFEAAVTSVRLESIVEEGRR